jgi:hypothetical protein
MKTLKTLILISMASLCLNLDTSAQYIPGAFSFTDLSSLFSNTHVGGSARIRAMGGAQYSLGGDISLASSNPAGLGFYRKSEFSISPSYNIFDIQSNYFGNINRESDTRINFANVGIVFNNSKDDIVPGAWRGGSFAISINKVNDFNANFFFQASGVNSSITDYFAENAFGIEEENMLNQIDIPALAYDSYIINPTYYFQNDGSSDKYITILKPEQLASQTEFIESRGGQYEWNFAYGGNFADKIYIGAGFGVTNIRYEVNKSFTEIVEPTSTTTPGLDLTLTESLRINGIGINGKIGIIAKPLPFLNIGASFTSPSIINADLEETPGLRADVFDINNQNYQLYFPTTDTTINVEPYNRSGDIFLSEFRVRTPYKLGLGTSVFLGKFGFISADVEYVNFASQKITSQDITIEEENTINRSIYESHTNVFNIRLGGEFRYNIFRLRGGFAHNPNPFQEGVNRSQTSISFGAGIRKQKFYVDLAYVARSFDSTYEPYPLGDDTPIATFNNNFDSAILSAGFFF